MWKCYDCGAEISKDKYKHCWNCGKPKYAADKAKPSPEKETPDLVTKTPRIIKPAAESKARKTIEDPPSSETKSLGIKDLFPQNDQAEIERKPTVIGKVIFFVLWLVAIGGLAYFASLSLEKTKNFEEGLAANLQAIQSQKGQFVFPPLPEMKRGTVIEGNLKPKVLPLNVKSGDVADLFIQLPDDLRPKDADEAKTMMWIDCQPNPLSPKQEKCTVYLVERETNKFIGIQNFLGRIPAPNLAQDESVGKVAHEKYIAYLREKQPESERAIMQTSSDSPNHHIFNKSEFILSLVLIGILVAIGLGWLAFGLRSANPEK